MHKQRAKARRVDFARHESDLQCVILAEAGWHTRAIAEKTGLTEGQVNLRCMQAGVKRRTYRDGKGILSQVIVDLTLNHMRKRAVQLLPSKIQILMQQAITHKEFRMWKEKV